MANRSAPLGNYDSEHEKYKFTGNHRQTAVMTNDVSKATVVKTVSGESLSFTAGAAGTTGTVMLTYSPIADANGEMVGSEDSSSFSFVTGTVLTTEIAYSLEKTDTVQLAAMSNGDYAINYVTGKILYCKATTATADTCNYKYRVQTSNTQSSSSDSSTGSDKVFEINSLSTQHKITSILDDTNISATTHYYPSATGSSMDGYRGISGTGTFIDADGTMTLSLQVTNDEDTSTAVWVAVEVYDENSSSMVANITVTNGTVEYAISKEDLDFKYYRWVVVNNGATNTAIIKERKKAL